MGSSNQSLKNTYYILKYLFVIVPIVAGLDKFANILTNWEQYISPTVARLLPISAATFMMIIGVGEIIAGFIVLKKPEVGGYIVATWLSVIALTLLAGFTYIDVAVRDFVMVVSAVTMAKLSKIISYV
ncbi:MAG: hypothetical protein H3C35_00370 [Bacteroidetes bacterium]|nr:hypothetical protein [Bacteroidota bacterium]